MTNEELISTLKSFAETQKIMREEMTALRSLVAKDGDTHKEDGGRGKKDIRKGDEAELISDESDEDAEDIVVPFEKQSTQGSTDRMIKRFFSKRNKDRVCTSTYTFSVGGRCKRFCLHDSESWACSLKLSCCPSRERELS